MRCLRSEYGQSAGHCCFRRIMSTAEAENEASSSSSSAKCRQTPSTEAPESVTYELEDHLALCKKTPTPSLTLTAEHPDDSGKNHRRHTRSAASLRTEGGVECRPVRFDGEVGKRDTLSMEIPEMEDGAEDERATLLSAGHEGKEAEAVFDSLLVHGAPLSPVAEMDETHRSTRATGHSFLTISTKSRPTPLTTHLDRTSMEEPEASSPVQGVVERDTGESAERQRVSVKSVRRSKDDLPNRDMTDMMDLDGDKESKPDVNGQRTPQRSQTEIDPAFSARRRSGSAKRSSGPRRSSTRGRSQTPRQKRLSRSGQSLKQGLLERLSAETGSWRHDLSLYLRVRFRDMDLSIVEQLTPHVAKLIEDPTDAECWLEFLRLDLHKTVQMDPGESMKCIRSSGECPPSLRTLYLWALKLSQAQDSEPSYQTLIRDEQQLGLATPSAEGFLLDAVFQLARLAEEPAARVDGSTTPRSTDLSLRETVMDLVNVEAQLIHALQEDA